MSALLPVRDVGLGVVVHRTEVPLAVALHPPDRLVLGLEAGEQVVVEAPQVVAAFALEDLFEVRGDEGGAAPPSRPWPRGRPRPPCSTGSSSPTL